MSVLICKTGLSECIKVPSHYNMCALTTGGRGFILHRTNNNKPSIKIYRGRFLSSTNRLHFWLQSIFSKKFCDICWALLSMNHWTPSFEIWTKLKKENHSLIHDMEFFIEITSVTKARLCMNNNKYNDNKSTNNVFFTKHLW